MEAQVAYLGSDEKRRQSIFSAKRIGGSRLSGGRDAGAILRIDADAGVTLSRFATRRFSSLRSKRASAKTERLCPFAHVQDARLSPDPVEQREGKWQIVLQTSPDAACVVHSFKSASVFEAVGWLQHIRVLQGRKELPVIVALGETGAGKSLLCSALAGLPADNAIFRVDSTLQSVTRATDMVLARWFGDESAEEAVIVDTPGLHDSEGQDAEHVADMLRKLSQLRRVHTFVLVLNAETPRFSSSLRAVLAAYERSFGPTFWNHACILFSHWYTNPDASKRRKERTERAIAQDWNLELSRRFPAVAQLPRVEKGLQCFFADADAPAGAASDATRAALAGLVTAAEGSSAMDVSAVLPDPSAALGGRDVPAAARGLAAFLRQHGLNDKLPRLLENGVESVEALAGLPNRVLRGVLQWSREDIKLLRGAGEAISVDAPNHVLVREFAALGLPTAKLEAAQISVKELLALDDATVCQRFGVKAGDLAVLAGWREQVMNGQPVDDTVLWEGAIVVRNAPGWQAPADDRRPQDFRGPGMLLNWRKLDGEVGGVLEAPEGWKGNPRAWTPPVYPGWVRVFWFNSGYTNMYRIGADGHMELKFALGGEHGVSRADPDDPFAAEFDDDAARNVRRPVQHKDLRCTFAFPKGQKYGHWAMFDVRPSVCRAAGGFEPGQVVRIRGTPQGGLEAKCIGVSCEEDGSVKLWFKVVTDEQIVGAGLFPDHMLGQLDLVRTEDVEETTYDDWECHSDDGIENDELDYVTKNLRMDFQYKTGVRFTEYASFDVRDEILDRFGYGLRHGDVIIHKTSNTKFVVIGASNHDSDSVRFWSHAVDRNPGASVWTALHNDLTQFERTGRKETVHQVAPPANNFTPPSEAEARAMALELTFEFPRGAGAFTTPQLFDTREAVCRRFCSLPSGAVLRGPDGKRLTVVGIAPDPDSGVASVWFHLEGHRGAGLIQNFARLLIGGVFTDTGERVDVANLRAEIQNAPEPTNPLQALMQALQAAADGAQQAQQQGQQRQPQGGGGQGGGDQAPPEDGEGGDDEDEAFLAFLRGARPPE